MMFHWCSKWRGRCFCPASGCRGTVCVTEMSTDYVEDLRERYTAVEGAWHFNKKYWNTIYLDRDMPDSEIKHWIHHSYREVIAKLPKKIREAYENE